MQCDRGGLPAGVTNMASVARNERTNRSLDLLNQTEGRLLSDHGISPRIRLVPWPHAMLGDLDTGALLVSVDVSALGMADSEAGWWPPISPLSYQ